MANSTKTSAIHSLLDAFLKSEQRLAGQARPVDCNFAADANNVVEPDGHSDIRAVCQSDKSIAKG